MKRKVWIVGASGLLGSAVKETFSHDPTVSLFTPISRFSWNNPLKLNQEFKAAINAFARHSTPEIKWLIVWAAGSGVIGATQHQMNLELSNLEMFLHFLHEEKLLSNGNGFFFLASTAGGAYGNSTDFEITEKSVCHPISEYGKGKLSQEDLVKTFCKQHPRIHGFIGRISSLYGIGQDLAKKNQGIISQFCRSSLLREPVNIFVPLDTQRDYYYAPDCAITIKAILEHWMELQTKLKCITKIFASGECASLSQLLGYFAQVCPTSLGILIRSTPVSQQHPHKLKYHSLIFPNVQSPHMPLAQGISIVYRYYYDLYLKGELRKAVP